MNAPMVKLVNTADLKSVAVRLPGSSPGGGTTKFCPCCGAAKPPEVPQDFKTVELLVIKFLRAHTGMVVTGRQISDYVYMGRKDGGPISAQKIIHVSVFNIRAKLGKDAIISKRGKYGGYTWGTVRDK